MGDYSNEIEENENPEGNESLTNILDFSNWWQHHEHNTKRSNPLKIINIVRHK